MDSGFWSAKLIRRLCVHQVGYSSTVRQTSTVRAAIAAISQDAWITIPSTCDGIAQVAQACSRGDRLIVRRVRNLGDQQQLSATWQGHAFVTNRVGTAIQLDADHHRHAVCELGIRDLKAEGLAHLPSGRFAANAAWLLAATLAHNLLRWTAILGLGVRDQLVVAKTLRRTLLALPGRLTRSARREAGTRTSATPVKDADIPVNGLRFTLPPGGWPAPRGEPARGSRDSNAAPTPGAPMSGRSEDRPRPPPASW